MPTPTTGPPDMPTLLKLIVEALRQSYLKGLKDALKDMQTFRPEASVAPIQWLIDQEEAK